MNIYITEACNLLITTKESKNGTNYGDELSQAGVEEVEWPASDTDMRLIGTAKLVYCVVGADGKTQEAHTPFWFDADHAKSAAKLMNADFGVKRKPCKVRKGYLIYPMDSVRR